MESSITTKVINKGAELIGAKNKASAEYYDYVSYTYIGLGILALALGVLSYLQKENHRFSGVAGALGIVAIAWEYVLIGVIIAIVIFILANIDISL